VSEGLGNVPHGLRSLQQNTPAHRAAIWALALAAWEGKAEAVGMLLQSGADPASVVSESGQTALHLAAAQVRYLAPSDVCTHVTCNFGQGHVAVIEAVLANVAPALRESLLELHNAGGASPLSVACQSSTSCCHVNASTRWGTRRLCGSSGDHVCYCVGLRHLHPSSVFAEVLSSCRIRARGSGG